MRSISNDLIILSEEVEWSRNYLIENLNEISTILQNVEASKRTSMHDELSQKIKECLGALDSLEEEPFDAVGIHEGGL